MNISINPLISNNFQKNKLAFHCFQSIFKTKTKKSYQLSRAILILILEFFSSQFCRFILISCMQSLVYKKKYALPLFSAASYIDNRPFFFFFLLFFFNFFFATYHFLYHPRFFNICLQLSLLTIHLKSEKSLKENN